MGDRETMSCVTRAVITFLETSLYTLSSLHARATEHFFNPILLAAVKQPSCAPYDSQNIENTGVRGGGGNISTNSSKNALPCISFSYHRGIPDGPKSYGF